MLVQTKSRRTGNMPAHFEKVRVVIAERACESYMSVGGRECRISSDTDAIPLGVVNISATLAGSSTRGANESPERIIDINYPRS